MAFYQLDPDSVSPEEYRQAQIDALILLVNCLEGYSENGYNHTAFNCWYCGFDKEVEWCGIFCSWALTEVGLAGEGPYALQGVNGPMNDITSWGSYAYNFGNINNHGQHINGDSIYDSGNNFYAENDRVHTADEVAAGEYVPQVGDIVVTPGGSGNGHVCILIAINDDGTYETMDGNAGSDCDEVSNKHNRTLDGIVCFCDNHSL